MGKNQEKLDRIEDRTCAHAPPLHVGLNLDVSHAVKRDTASPREGMQSYRLSHTWKHSDAPGLRDKGACVPCDALFFFYKKKKKSN